VVTLLSSEQNDAVCDATEAEQELNDGFQAMKTAVANPVKSLRTGLVHHETIDDIMSLCAIKHLKN